MKHEAIYNLYPNVKSIVENETLTAYDINEQIVSIDMSAVNAKALELQSIKEAKKQAKIDTKASALAKLTALGLTEEEVKSIL
jgi:hypothetical protein